MPSKRACSVEDCFFERDVRDFEVIDQTHVIVYAGSQRCAFHIELRGTLCDLYVRARALLQPSQRDSGRLGRPLSGDPCGRGRGSTPSTPRDGAVAQPRTFASARTISTIQVHGGRFTESGVDRRADGPLRQSAHGLPECRRVTSVTDDQLVEFYVGRGVLPPCRRWEPEKSRSASRKSRGRARSGSHREPERRGLTSSRVSVSERSCTPGACPPRARRCT